ncbi:hypothetical protein HPP92_015259 [Vanilla planifolia]|uniref:Enhancer of polycomb-like protein n=1 Tax=Vanilla planifolia TaxID=51239 RepID=A0A835QPT3_VANPL|nr:hypothetical protein HPP92_015259 [Vanilla planifolia]
MSRLSFRPRPLDIHKKLPIVKNVKDFDDDEVPIAAASTRNSQILRIAAEADNEVHQISIKKVSSEIPHSILSLKHMKEIIPELLTNLHLIYVAEEVDVTCHFTRAEVSDFVEYDLDNEDEDWLQELNRERKILPPEKFENLLFKLEVLDHKAREKAGTLQLTFISPVPVFLQLDAAAEALQVSLQDLQLFSLYISTGNQRLDMAAGGQFSPELTVEETACSAESLLLQSVIQIPTMFSDPGKAHPFTPGGCRGVNNVQSFESFTSEEGA